MIDDNLTAALVWDGNFDTAPIVPSDLLPLDDRIASESLIKQKGQLQGTPAEQMIEIAGRCCYDSLGKGRPSDEYHKHLLEVGHWSVHEHINLTFEVPTRMMWILGLMGRPGVSMRYRAHDDMCVTLNLRTLLDWATHSKEKLDTIVNCNEQHMAQLTMDNQYRIFCHFVHKKVPSIIPDPPGAWRDDDPVLKHITPRIVEPEDDRERFVSMFFSGSRGFTHELVRHRHQMAFSQRSTRYVDENETPWVKHPLITSIIGESTGNDAVLYLLTPFRHTVKHAQYAYTTVVDQLQKTLLDKGVDKLTARKQARGAARGLLGNALRTEIVATASVAQWKHMLHMRCSPFADAEIRVLFAMALRELKRSRWGSCFEEFTLKPSPDGIGEVLNINW